LLPRKVQFLNSRDVKRFSQLGLKRRGIPNYFVFTKEDKPDFCREYSIIWDESGWGIYKV